MGLALGTMRRGRELRLTDEERSRHIHIVGGSGTGKSKLLEALIRQDILSGRGLCLIDPHGTLADKVIAWCAALRLSEHRRIHVIDPKDQTWSAGFNPLRDDGDDGVYARVKAMVATCAEVWGGEDLDQTPLLATCLELVFYALAVQGLTLVEAKDLTANADPDTIRERLTKDLPDPVYNDYWREFSVLSKRDFEDRFSSTRRRLLRFLGSPVVRRIVGQRQHAIDFRRIMDEGDIVIVNLLARGPLSEENGRLLGALITSELRLCAMGRDEATALRRPFSLYIDECYDYLTGDVEKMLDQTRKFGLHVVLAHQRLGQLQDRSKAVYNGVMAGGQTKIVFGGLEDDDAEVMAKQVYRSTFNLERPKHLLDKPIAVDEVPYWLESQSWTESNSVTNSSSESSTWTTVESTSSGVSTRYGAEDVEPFGHAESEATASSVGQGGGFSTGRAETSGSAQSHGQSQTLKSVRVVMPTAVHSLDEEVHLAIVKLRELPNQAAIVKRRGKVPVRIQPATVKPALAWPELVEGFIDGVQTASPYVATAASADAEIRGRLETLRGAQQGTGADENYWVE